MRPVLELGACIVLLMWFMRRSAGRLAPRVAFAPVVFLATRWPVLVAWTLGTLGWLAMLVPQMEAKGRGTPANYAFVVFAALMSGGGVAVLLVGPGFFVARAFTPAPVIRLEPGEELLAEYRANHFLKGEGRGGKLLLTSKRLAFRPHRFNVQLEPWSVPLADLERVETEGARMLLVHVRGQREPAWLVAMAPGRVAERITEAMATNAR